MAHEGVHDLRVTSWTMVVGRGGAGDVTLSLVVVGVRMDVLGAVLENAEA